MSIRKFSYQNWLITPLSRVYVAIAGRSALHFVRYFLGRVLRGFCGFAWRHLSQPCCVWFSWGAGRPRFSLGCTVKSIKSRFNAFLSDSCCCAFGSNSSAVLFHSASVGDVSAVSTWLCIKGFGVTVTQSICLDFGHMFYLIERHTALFFNTINQTRFLYQTFWHNLNSAS